MEWLPPHLLPLLLALLSGILMAVQGSINAGLSKVIGLWEATFVVHVLGTVFLVAVLFFFKLGRGDLTAINQAPWYSFLGGLASIFIIYLVAASIPSVGVANATTAIIFGQVLTALVIDYFGLFGLAKVSCGWNQFLGLILLAIGAKLLLK